MKVLALLGLLSACHAPKAPEKDPVPVSVEQSYVEAVNRLERGFLQGGWVVSRHPDGAPAHMGEGLIWSGLALAALPCDRGQEIEAALLGMLAARGGALVRIDPLGEYADGREVTLDGALGLYRGIAERVTRCGDGDRWANAVGLHRRFVSLSGGRLHPNTAQNLLPQFDFLLDLLAFRLGQGESPNPERARFLEHQVALWAAGVKATQGACYRINLGLITLQTLEALGEPVSRAGRDEFCLATKGTGIPTVDEWCGRGGLKDWIASYRMNQWEYRFQRCGGWETPDGAGLATPGLDYLVAIRQAYNLEGVSP